MLKRIFFLICVLLADLIKSVAIRLKLLVQIKKLRSFLLRDLLFRLFVMPGMFGKHISDDSSFLKFVKLFSVYIFIPGALPGGRCFDPRWYRIRYPDIPTDVSALAFHLFRGEREGRDPSPFFSTIWYRETNLLDGMEWVSPLLHFVLSRDLKIRSHPLYLARSVSPVYDFFGKHTVSFLSKPNACWGISTPNWIIEISKLYFCHESVYEHKCDSKICTSYDMNMDNPIYWQVGTSRNIKMQCIRAADFCFQNDRSVIYTQTQPPALVKKPIHSYNTSSKKFPRGFIKVGRQPYIACPGTAFVSGGISGYIALDGTPCFDSMSYSLKRNDSFSVVPCNDLKDEPRFISFHLTSNIIPRGVTLTYHMDFNYYHWIVEGLPRLTLVNDHDQFSRYPLLVSERLHPNILRSIELLAPQRQIIEIQRFHLSKVIDLVYPSEFNMHFKSYTGVPINSAVPTDLEMVRKTVQILKASVPVNFDAPARIFFQRKDKRTLVNSEEVQNLLERYGFVTFYPEDLTLDEQIALCSKSKIFLTVGGSGATNILFCSKNAIVGVFSHHGMDRAVRTWQMLAHISQTRLYCFFGPNRFIYKISKPINVVDKRFGVDIISLLHFLDSVKNI